jgi:hypothetical protein
MDVPRRSYSLTPAQIEELNRQLQDMRHEVNNHLALIVATGELLQHRCEAPQSLVATLLQQPPLIIEKLEGFSRLFEQTFGLPSHAQREEENF